MLTEYICISKDRACQLDLHIRCAIEKYTQLNKIYILYTYSNDFYKEGYNKLIQNNYDKVVFIKEDNFKNDMIDIVKNKIKGNYFLMLCDDSCFIDSFDDKRLSEMFSNNKVHSVSIRLADTMNINSVTRHTMKIPNFIYQDKNTLLWDWTKENKRFDWGYPMAATGTIFRKKDIIPFLEKFQYKNSGQLESQMNHNRMIDKPLMYSFNKCCMVDLPLNNIIKETNNSNKKIEIEFLNSKYLNGEIIFTTTAYNIDTKQSFMDYDFDLVWRFK